MPTKSRECQTHVPDSLRIHRQSRRNRKNELASFRFAGGFWNKSSAQPLVGAGARPQQPRGCRRCLEKVKSFYVSASPTYTGRCQVQTQFLSVRTAKELLGRCLQACNDLASACPDPSARTMSSTTSFPEPPNEPTAALALRCERLSPIRPRRRSRITETQMHLPPSRTAVARLLMKKPGEISDTGF